MSEQFDPLARKAQADAIVERAAEGLRQLLQEAVARLEPFPSFPGAYFTWPRSGTDAATLAAAVW
jgi:hypothetical protein